MAKNKKMTPQEKQQVYEKGHAELLKKLELSPMFVIEFKDCAVVPVLSRIALKIIARQGGRAGVRFVDLSK